MTLESFASRCSPTGDLWLRFAPKGDLIEFLLHRIHEEGQDAADAALTYGDARTASAIANYHKIVASNNFKGYRRSTLALMINALPVPAYKVTSYVAESTKLPELFIRESAFFADVLAGITFTHQAQILAVLHNASEDFRGDLSSKPKGSHRHLKAVLKFIAHFKDKESLVVSRCPALVVTLLESNPEIVTELVEFADSREVRMDRFDIELFYSAKNSNAVALSEGVL
jgi:hypothetical protein